MIKLKLKNSTGRLLLATARLRICSTGVKIYRPFFIVWASPFNPLLGRWSGQVRSGVEQPFDCLIIQNRQAMRYIGRSLDYAVLGRAIPGGWVPMSGKVSQLTIDQSRLIYSGTVNWLITNREKLEKLKKLPETVAYGKKSFLSTESDTKILQSTRGLLETTVLQWLRIDISEMTK